MGNVATSPLPSQGPPVLTKGNGSEPHLTLVWAQWLNHHIAHETTWVC